MTIKYNPFIASSILLAVLMYSFESGKAKCSNKKFEPKFKYDTEGGEEDVIEFFNKKQKEAKHDDAYLIYPKDSIFRNTNVPLLLWSVTDNDWKKKDSTLIQTAVVCLHGNIAIDFNRSQLELRLKVPGQEASLSSLSIKGEALVKSKLFDLVQDKAVQKKLLALWTKKEVKPKKEEEKTEGEPKEDKEV